MNNNIKGLEFSSALFCYMQCAFVLYISSLYVSNYPCYNVRNLSCNRASRTLEEQVSYGCSSHMVTCFTKLPT